MPQGASSAAATLPQELWVTTLEHLGADPHVLLTLRGVNRAFAAACDHAAVWRPHLAAAPTPQRGGRQTYLHARDHLTLPATAQAPATTHWLGSKATVLRHLYALARANEPPLRAAFARAAAPPQPLSPAAYFDDVLRTHATSPPPPRPLRPSDDVVCRLQDVVAFLRRPPATLLGVSPARYDAALAADHDLAAALVPLVPYTVLRQWWGAPPPPRWVQLALPHDGAALLDVASPTSTQVAAALRTRPQIFSHVDAALRRDPTLVRLAARGDLRTLAHADAVLRAEPTFAAQLLREVPGAWPYLSAALRTDAALACLAAAGQGAQLGAMDADLRATREVVLAAVGQDGLALAHADAALRDDDAVVGAAVRQCGAALAHASARLQADAAVVRAAAAQDGLALRYAAAEVVADPTVTAAALQQNPLAFALLPAWWQLGPEAAQQLLLCAPASRDRLPQETLRLPAHYGQQLQTNLFAANPWLFAALPESCHDDRTFTAAFVRARLRHDGLNLRFFAPAWTEHAAYVRLAVAGNGLALAFAGPYARGLRDVVLAAVAQNGLALAYVAPSLQADVDVVAVAVAQNYMALEFAAPALQFAPAFAQVRAAWLAGRSLVRSQGYAARLLTAAATQHDATGTLVHDGAGLWCRAVGAVAHPSGHAALTLVAGPTFAPFAGRTLPAPPALLQAANAADALGAALPPPLVRAPGAALALVPRLGAPLQPRHLSTARFVGEMAWRFTPAGEARAF